jgi:hypothetical protein
VDLARDPAVEVQLLTPGDPEAGVVFGFPAGDVVGLDGVEVLAGADAEPPPQRPLEPVEVGDVEPSLVGEAFVAAADDRSRELAAVGSVALPAADVEVADDPGALAVEEGNCPLRCFEAVDVVDAGPDRRVDAALQLPLPRLRRRPGMPARAVRTAFASTAGKGRRGGLALRSTDQDQGEEPEAEERALRASRVQA